MVKKAELAKFIRTGNHSASEWYQFMPKIKGLRVKEVGSQGEVRISLDDSGWYDPRGWLANYRASIREELDRELKKAKATLAQQELEEILLQFVTPTAAPATISINEQTLLQTARNSDWNANTRLAGCLKHVLDATGYSVLSMRIEEAIKANPYFGK